MRQLVLILLMGAGMTGCATFAKQPAPVTQKAVESKAALTQRLEAAIVDYGNSQYARAADELRAVLRIALTKETNTHTAFIQNRAMTWLTRVNLKKDSNVLQQVARQHELTIPFNRAVDKWINYYLTRGRYSLDLWLERSGKYEAIIWDIFRDYGIPKELTYLAFVESGFSPFVRSSKDAVGMWQFRENTSQYYDLEVTWWQDERRHVERATHAAARHLTHLYETFADWELALAAYNAGEYRVKNALKQQGDKTFWELILPRETEVFVPKIYAAALICSDPEAFGVTIEKATPRETAIVTFERPVSFETIARAANISKTTLVELNPHLVAQITPGTTETAVTLPTAAVQTFEKQFATLPENEKYLSDDTVEQIKANSYFTWYTVETGDSLWWIARKHDTHVKDVKRWNRLSGNIVRPGQRLRIYR